jgi:hypothetical protein
LTSITKQRKYYSFQERRPKTKRLREKGKIVAENFMANLLKQTGFSKGKGQSSGRFYFFGKVLFIVAHIT